MGAGKTSIGRRLAERFGLAFVDADREIELRTGASVTTIFECEGEAGFRERERAALADLLAAQRYRHRHRRRRGARCRQPRAAARARLRGATCTSSIDDQLARLARDRARPLLRTSDDGDDREALLRRLAGVREPLYAEVADLRFDTDGAGAGRGRGKAWRTCWKRAGSAAPMSARCARQAS